MTREQIEKAARIERENVHKELQENYRKHKDINLYTAFSATIDMYAVPLFKAGAQWRINSVFHKVSEEPEDEKFPILVEYSACGIDGFCFTVCDDALDYDICRHLSYCTVLSWAYVDDLLPERKEETNGGR